MSTPANTAWRNKYESGDLRVTELSDMLAEWDDQVDSLEGSRDEKIEQIEGLEEDLKRAEAAPPEWGNCRRGCEPAYLDRDGFCSPACALGAPRGEFVTVVQDVPAGLFGANNLVR